MVQARLELLSAPAIINSPWSGPFEQLTGAAYALFEADRYEIWTRNFSGYHAYVRRRVPELIMKYRTNDEVSEEFKTWISGFYFNSGIQRIVWASERLLKAMARIDCRCGRPGEIDPKTRKFSALLRAVVSRVEHVIHNQEAQLDHVRKVAVQLEKPYERDHPLDTGRTLAMMRYDVNKRKHSVYFFHFDRDRVSAGEGSNETWSTTGVDIQMQLACESFDLVGGAYSGLLAWYPDASKAGAGPSSGQVTR